MPVPGPFSRMSLIQATITFVIAFFAINIVIDVLVFGVEPTRNLARHLIVAVLVAPLWYMFVRWMRTRRG